MTEQPHSSALLSAALPALEYGSVRKRKCSIQFQYNGMGVFSACRCANHGSMEIEHYGGKFDTSVNLEWSDDIHVACRSRTKPFFGRSRSTSMNETV